MRKPKAATQDSASGVGAVAPVGLGWTNRIVGAGTVRAGDLLANESNWRIHPLTQQEALGGVLNEVGWVTQVVVNRRSDEAWGEKRNIETLVDGHLRVMLALGSGEDAEVPVTYVDLLPHEEALILATFDPLSAMAVADTEQLGALLQEIAAADEEALRVVQFIARSDEALAAAFEGTKPGRSQSGSRLPCVCPNCGDEHEADA